MAWRGGAGTKEPQLKSFVDDGYSRLDVMEYLTVRTHVALRRIKRELKPAQSQLMVFQILVGVATLLSVVLGSTNNDLFIASSTAFVSFFSTCLEYGQYKEYVQAKQRACKMLQRLELQFRALPFQMKRHGPQRDRLVRETEEAIMSVFNRFYQPPVMNDEEGAEGHPSAPDDSSAAQINQRYSGGHRGAP